MGGGLYDLLLHSAKGSTWEEHKYVKRIDGTYYYPDGYENGRNISSLEGSKKEESDSDGGSGDLSENDIENLAREVIRGNFGNGQVRKDLLAGNYDSVQKRVNELMKSEIGSTKMSEASKEVEDKGKIALEKASNTVSRSADINRIFSVYNKHRAKESG